MSRDQSLPVFVSSTFSDLQLYRTAVREALHRLETVVRGMEYFGASPETPKDECLRIVRSCKVYIGIFAMRYGSIDPDTGKSFTHLEYDEAQRLRLPSLIYLIDEERQPVLPRDIDFGEAAEKLNALKAVLRQKHVISKFTTPDDLAARISRDVPALAGRIEAVNSNRLADVVGTLPRHPLTDERFEFLKKEIGESGAILGSDELLRETVEYLVAGERQAPFLLLSRRCDLGGRDVVDVLMEIEKKLFAIIERGARQLREGQRTASHRLSPEALELLVAGAADPQGTIFAVQMLHGFDVKVGNRNFVEPRSPRTEAKWRAVVQELAVAGLIAPGNAKREWYSVTDEGYQLAEAVGKERAAGDCS